MVARGCCLRGAYVLLDVFLARVHGALAHLEAQLGRGVVDEAAERGRDVALAVATLLGGHALLLAVAIAALGLRRRLGGRRRAQLRDG